MTTLTSISDAMGKATSVINRSDQIYAIILSSGTPKQVTIPNNSGIVLFQATGPFWAKIGGAAAVPSSDITDGSASEFCPQSRIIKGVTTIGLVASTSVTVTLSFYEL